MIELGFSAARGDQRPKGTWKPLGTPTGKSASVSCPQCGEISTLDGHDIAADGTVTPSAVCPYTGSLAAQFHCVPCTFHDHIKLAGWARWLEESATPMRLAAIDGEDEQ